MSNIKEMLKAFQDIQPWTDIWSAEFLADQRSYAKLEHCLINIIAKAGAILQQIELSDHYGQDYELGLNKQDIGVALSYIIMSAFKAANVYPDEKIDLSKHIIDDLIRREVLEK